MRKADVRISYHNGTRGKPMVNVKVHVNTGPDALRAVVASDPAAFPDPLFPAWLDTLTDDGRDAAWMAALEDGWNQLADDVGNAFPGYRAKVYSAGRSGGWAVVEGLPEIESWDAIQLGRWAQYAKWARQTADGVPYMMVDFLYHNPFAAYRETIDACAAVVARDAGVSA